SFISLLNTMAENRKTALYEACRAQIARRIETATAAMEAAQKAANSETKSSVGDKYETGRAMMQRERDKAALQLAAANELAKILDEIDPTHTCTEAELGAVVDTSRGTFFLAVAAGLLNIDGQKCFAVSPASPVGKAMLGKKVGDSFVVNGNTFEMKAVE
ncbi:MAG: GreA/GreB family elongation factor, partial [Bacteroidota bacterium]